MFNDNVYPNGFKYHREPEAQVKAKEAEAEDVLKQLPVLKEVLEHLDTQITFLGSIDSIEADLSKDPTAHQRQVAANKLAKAFLEAERGFIQSKVEQVK